MRRVRESIGQALRFAAVGAATNAVGFVLYLLATGLGGTPKATMSVLYVVGTATGFWGNRTVTFGHSGSLTRAGVRYAAAYAVGYLINFAILAVMVDRLGYPHQVAQAIATVLVAVFLFVALKLYVFREDHR